MSQIDWERATVTVRAPVVHTATEDVQEFEVPLERLVRILCATRGHLRLPSLSVCARCGEVS